MMSKELRYLHEIRNPADLALAEVDVELTKHDVPVTPEEEESLHRLDSIGVECGFHDRAYMVEATQGFALPTEPEDFLAPAPRVYEKHLIFCGTLKTYAIVAIGRIAVAEVDIRALCLSFGDVQTLSRPSLIDYDQLLHVPAYSIDYMSKLYQGGSSTSI